jgi:uncharacterized protein (DUF58 family)
MRVGDLLGFFPRKKQVDDLRHVVVYPRLIPLKPLVLPRRDVWGIPGAKSPIYDPIYVFGTRDYHHSQPAKYIHWKASARYNFLAIFYPDCRDRI